LRHVASAEGATRLGKNSTSPTRLGMCTIRAMANSFYKTGSDRQQAQLLPARIEDYVGRNNAVRAIEAYVGSLDLAELKFAHAVRVAGAGQPPYDPADLLKLYLYGYLNQIRSSRRLEREAGRNIELMWLLRGLQPGYRTIGQFRSDNVGPLKQANRDFVLVLRALDLVGRELVAIDGAFFDGSASKASIVTRKRLDEQLATVEREIAAVEHEIAAYTAALDANDTAEAGEPEVRPQPDEDVAARLAALLAKRRAVAGEVATLAASGQTQLSRTDADARLLSKNGQSVAGYNVQIAVEARHKLIVACEAVNDGNDTGQLHAMAQAARAAVGADQLRVVADTGYFNGETLKACEDSGIEAFVPEPRRGTGLEEAGRFGVDAFSYDAEADAYRCPAGALLRAMGGGKLDQSGKLRIRYASRRLVCSGCSKRAKCLAAKATRRVIERWEHEDVIERHRRRMASTGEAVMRCRKALAEHPFGTLKCRAGYRHFLMRGFDKVRGELGLMVLCYNFTRALNLIGLEGLVAWFAARSFLGAFGLLAAVFAAAERLRGGRCLGRSKMMATVAGPLRHLRTAHSGDRFAT
jgi:transposase